MIAKVIFTTLLTAALVLPAVATPQARVSAPGPTLPPRTDRPNARPDARQPETRGRPDEPAEPITAAPEEPNQRRGPRQ
jgi:hypothetical protein